MAAVHFVAFFWQICERNAQNSARLETDGSREMIRMLRTIQIGSCVSVQGLLAKQLSDGKIVVRVGDKTFEGTPVSRPN